MEDIEYLKPEENFNFNSKLETSGKAFEVMLNSRTKMTTEELFEIYFL